MESLYRSYWYPLYTYVRRLGYAPADAQDLLQAFFARLIEKNAVAAASPVRGRFRSFLLASLKHFLANEWDRARALKRGGGRAVIPIDGRDAESRYAIEPGQALTPERLFERRWALTLLDSVLSELSARYAAAGKRQLFERLKPLLGGGSADEGDYAAVAAELGMTAAAVAMAVHRLRRRYREILRARIAGTVESEQDVEDEIRFLFEAVGR
jgi:RNA polymerase sigma-70 factor (ECF subfamily)